MKKILLGVALFIVIFTGSALTFNFIGNRGFEDKAVEEVESTLELAYISFDGRIIDPMEAFRTDVIQSVTRNVIVPVDQSKTVTVLLPEEILDGRLVTYELRDMSGENLIEEGAMSDAGSSLSGYRDYEISLRMDLTLGKEYSFIVRVSQETSKYDRLSYYTRIKRLDSERTLQLLEYAESFSNAILSDNAAATIDDARLEGGYYGNSDIEPAVATVTDAEQGVVATATDAYSILNRGYDVEDAGSLFGGDGSGNSTYGYITLQSDYSDVVMEGIRLDKPEDVIPSLREVDSDSATVEISYRGVNTINGNVRYFSVSEYIALEYNSSDDSIRIAEFVRTIDEDFTKDDIEYSQNRIRLGLVSDENVEYLTSETSKQIAFLMDNGLWYYSSAGSYYAKLYGQSVSGEKKSAGYGIKLLYVDENIVDFIVYGRIPYGSHVGENGVALYEYSVEGDSLSEIDMITTSLPFEVLSEQSGMFSYYDRTKRYFYTILGDSLLKINVINGQSEELISGIPAGDIFVSDDGETIAYPDSADSREVNEITLLNINSNTSVTLSEEGEKLTIIDFVGNDLVYGTALPEDIHMGADGLTVFLFDKLYITGSDGEVKKTYDKEGVFIDNLWFENDNIYLKRVTKNEGAGTLAEISDDYIAYKPEYTAGTVSAVVHFDQNSVAGIYLDIPSSVYMSGNVNEIITKLSVKEKARTQKIDGTMPENMIYIFSAEGLSGMSRSAGKAISEAAVRGGFVVDGSGQILYREKQLKPFLTLGGSFEEIPVGEGSILDESKRVCEEMLLDQAGRDAEILNISGVDSGTAIRFISDGAAFIARLSDRYVIVFSYNADFVRYYDPVDDDEYRVGRYTFARDTRNAGNEFYTWIVE